MHAILEYERVEVQLHLYLPYGNEWAEVQLHEFLTSAPHGNKRSASRPDRFSRGKSLRYLLNRRMDTRQS